LFWVKKIKNNTNNNRFVEHHSAVPSEALAEQVSSIEQVSF